MPSDDYTSTVRGSLKLKGSHPSGVIKKKKKKTKPTTTTTSAASIDAAEESKSAIQQALEDEDEKNTTGRSREGAEPEGEELTDEQLRDLDPKGGDGKTASERAYEEMRRKRLQDRLQKEGVKTHKQRVEELNKYLSNLSEHHDMPRIGPG